MIRRCCLSIGLLLCLAGLASAQVADRVYVVREVDQRAVITSKPEPLFTEKARKKNTHGTVILRMVLDASGEVTDIVVVKKLKNGLTEEAIKAARRITFQPAQKDGRAVSQYVTVVYHFNTF